MRDPLGPLAQRLPNTVESAETARRRSRCSRLRSCRATARMAASSPTRPSIRAASDSSGGIGERSLTSWGETPAWVDGRVLVNLDEGRRRLEHLRQEPRVSLTVLGREDWHHHVTLRGRVAELMPDPQFTDIDRLSEHYTGRAYPQRGEGRVSAWIEVTSWHAWAVNEPCTVGR
jgi:hypothetical protein